jgi:spore maturation protein CgeB
VEWLERVCRDAPVSIWGQGVEELSAGSPIRPAFHGPAWGLDMFRILSSSRITLNHHIGIAGAFANNMRLYETTGVGSLLLTDWKQNLGEMFEPGVEVAVYRNAEECAEKIRYYLANEEERARIAHAGQQRTLGEHSYRQRMVQLVGLVEALL